MEALLLWVMEGVGVPLSLSGGSNGQGGLGTPPKKIENE
jgi:hypothetical protein